MDSRRFSLKTGRGGGINDEEVREEEREEAERRMSW
jgi:hypothetical protein